MCWSSGSHETKRWHHDFFRWQSPKDWKVLYGTDVIYSSCSHVREWKKRIWQTKWVSIENVYIEWTNAIFFSVITTWLHRNDGKLNGKGEIFRKIIKSSALIKKDLILVKEFPINGRGKIWTAPSRIKSCPFSTSPELRRQTLGNAGSRPEKLSCRPMEGCSGGEREEKGRQGVVLKITNSVGVRLKDAPFFHILPRSVILRGPSVFFFEGNSHPPRGCRGNESKNIRFQWQCESFYGQISYPKSPVEESGPNDIGFSWRVFTSLDRMEGPSYRSRRSP